MIPFLSDAPPDTTPVDAGEKDAVQARFAQALDGLRRYHDRFFAWLLLGQWIAAIVLALVVSPRTWAGTAPSVHVHVWTAVLVGGTIVLLPAWMGFFRTGQPATRHLIASAQMLLSALLIHLTGGRIETHFHVFGSLAFLAAYRDARVLVTATVLVYVDHLLRGVFWPQSVYGVFTATSWRSLEHAGWVLFEVFFLVLAIRRGLAEMYDVARRQVSLERMNADMELTVRNRTRELAESEARFRALFQHMPVGLYRARADGVLQFANPAMLKILGVATEDEMRAQGVRLQGSAGEPARREFFQAIVEHGAAEGRETAWTRVGGTKTVLRENARAVRDADGSLLHIDGSAEDITAHRQLEERYLQAQKVQAVGQLAGGVAHDFNNILTAIIGFSDLLLSGDPLTPASRQCVLDIRRASDRAAALTRQMLAFSRKQTLQPTVLQLNGIVGDLERMLRRIVGEHITITAELAPDLRLVKVDAAQIQQVILNLVVNARDAMPDGGRLAIRTHNLHLDAVSARHHPGTSAGDHVVLEVSDTGCGMTPEVKMRLFEPFFTTKAPGSGTGLGLATCHGIVTQSGGHITVYSEPGLGTTFRVYLPASAEAVAKREGMPVLSSGRAQGGSETILLVEDDPQVQATAVAILTSLGYEVLKANNGREALECFMRPDRPPIHLVVTDLIMPEMGGRDLARQLRPLSPQLPIIFASGFAFDALHPADLAQPGSYFLNKPYNLAQLAGVVREALDGVQRHQPQTVV